MIYIQGTGGDLADMDIDCDGAQKGKLDDGRCGSSTDTQSQTAFKSKVAGYNKGIKDLDSFAHPYVVFGNQGSKAGYQTFDAEAYGVEPLSVIAVVCNNKMVRRAFFSQGTDSPCSFFKANTSSSLAFGVTPTATTTRRPWSARLPSPWPRFASAKR